MATPLGHAGEEVETAESKEFLVHCDLPCPIREPAPQAQLPVGWGPAPNQALEHRMGGCFHTHQDSLGLSVICQAVSL